jgi:hypothetical protein
MADIGTFFPLAYTPPTTKNFACGEQKKKFLRKVFYYVEKIVIPPNQVERDRKIKAHGPILE